MSDEFVEVPPEELLSEMQSMLMGEKVAAPRVEKIKEILQQLIQMNNKIEAVIVATVEGFPVTSYAQDKSMLTEEGRLIEEGKIAAAITVIFSTAERNAMDLRRGHVDHVMIKTDNGYIVLRLAGEDYIIGAVTRIDAKLGVILRDLKWACDKILEVLRE